MSQQIQINLRTRKLGVLIRDARLAARKNIADLSAGTGISPELFSEYEEGRKAPSLPEVEALAYYLNVPIRHFWSSEALSVGQSALEPVKMFHLSSLRQRMIGVLLRQKRLQAEVDLTALAADTGISEIHLTEYELGESPVPLPELEAILKVTGGQVEMFYDKNSPIGKWMAEQETIQEFLKLPGDLQAFIITPANRPTLELVQKLSQLPKQ